MKAVFLATLSPMLMLFVCILIGYLLNRLRLAPDNTATVLSKLATWVLCPCLNLTTFMKYCTPESFLRHGKMLLYSALVLAVAVGLATVLSLLFAKKGYSRNIYQYALVFANYGFMANAIVPVILGEEALYVYMLFTLPMIVVGYTWGAAILIPHKETGNPWKRLLNPTFFSVALGLVLGLTGTAKYVPGFLQNAFSGLGSCTGVVAMVLTGFLIGSYPLGQLLRQKKVYVASILRLFVLPAIFLTGLKLLGADELTMKLCFFAYATPLGLNTVVFPAAYGGDPTIGAAMATVSHTLCVASIPLMYSLLTLLVGGA